jgi:hypothetical protein
VDLLTASWLISQKIPHEIVKKERTWSLVGVLLLGKLFCCFYCVDIKSRSADHCQNPNAIISSPHRHHNQLGRYKIDQRPTQPKKPKHQTDLNRRTTDSTDEATNATPPQPQSSAT